MPRWWVRLLMVVALLWASPVLAPPGAAGGARLAAAQELSAALEQTLPRPAQDRELDQVLREVERAARAGQRPVVVFDIDDTLIRWRKVGDQKVSVTDMPGAADYVHTLSAAGARIVYLTARPERLRRTTERLLRRMGLALGPGHPLMMMQPGARSFVESKADARGDILALGRPLALFDNDLANVRLFRSQYPGARVFRVVGHSGTRDPSPELGQDGIRVLSDLARTGRGMRSPGTRGTAAHPRAVRSRTARERAMQTRATRARAARRSARARRW